MCRSCDQTPDGSGRRCPNRADGFTTRESDQRTRSRGLNAAQDALSEGEHQEAANALARAVAAQRELDGANSNLPQRASVPEGPSREVFVSPRDLGRVRADLDNVVALRAREGREPLHITMTTQRRPHPEDPMLMQERVRVRMSGVSADELSDVQLPNVTDEPENVVRTDQALAVAHAITRISGGYRSKAEGGEQSTSAMLNAYLAATPDSALRASVTVTAEDRAAAARTLGWARSEQPTSDWMRSVQTALSDDAAPYRSLALAVSAIPVADRSAQRRADAAPAASGPVAGPGAQAESNPVRKSVWLGEIGERGHVTGTVEAVRPVSPPSDPGAVHYLHSIRTQGGASVKWFAPGDTDLHPGDEITLTGTVTKHEEFNGQRQTVFGQCDRPVRHHRATAS